MLEAALTLQPEDSESLIQLGMVNGDLRELVGARRRLEQAVALDSAHVHALVSLGVAALRAGNPTSAQAPLEQARTLSPGNPSALRALGQARMIRNDLEGPQPLMAPNILLHWNEADARITRALALGPPADPLRGLSAPEKGRTQAPCDQDRSAPRLYKPLQNAAG